MCDTHIYKLTSEIVYIYEIVIQVFTAMHSYITVVCIVAT